MDTRTRTILMWVGVAVLIISGLSMLALAFGGGKNSAVEVDAIYTNAALTVAAQQQTLQAGTIASTPTSPATPTHTSTPIPSPTTQPQVSAPLPTISSGAGAPVAVCDNAVYVSDVTIPDGMTVPAGQSFTKTWRVRNTGSCAWKATYQLTFVSGDSLGGKATAIGRAVGTGEVVDVSVVLTSSLAGGTLKGVWKLTNDRGQTFGDALTVVITNGSAKTVTPFTPTITPTPTNTPIVIVVTATFSPVPTAALPTDTPVPTPTATPE